MKEPKQVYAIQCAECLRVIGISWAEIRCLTKCLKCSSSDEEKDVWLEPQCQYDDCEFCTDRPIKPSACRN